MQIERKRMILRRLNADGPTSAEVAVRVKEAPGLTVLQETSPSTLLVEGLPDTIAQVLDGFSGWRALPMTKIQVPDAKPRILNPAER